ncbi:MAG: YceI family protein [Hymenobacteraceae bacterium]|nr:YceI family protein [Hymenobacteraceae bacterium]MDX5397658.1 YceI family protein [Hymenobacteraceae bacterium]MDX5513735.1 YceI family protein [Hymenobacteraceae bacterium]
MKKRIFFLLSAILMAGLAQAQDRYFTKNGNISFYASTPLETVEAHNNKATSVIDITTGKMEFAVLMKAFQFEKALMQEHFNENYVESDKYPKSTFAGQITNPSAVDFKKDGTYPVKVKGNLTIHGVTKEIEAPGTVTVKNGNIKATSEFIVKPEDYNIQIPGVVREKIAKEVKVKADMDYQPLK